MEPSCGRLCSSCPGILGLVCYSFCCCIPCRKRTRMRDQGILRPVLLLGCENSGKTEFVSDGCTGGPTLGVRRSRVKFGANELDVCEVGGAENMRQYWWRYFEPHMDILFFAKPNLEQGLKALAMFLNDIAARPKVVVAVPPGAEWVERARQLWTYPLEVDFVPYESRQMLLEYLFYE
eukprot:GEMP01043324.1.p1 GENE.GEMP01043324.1~~GEMP01043324.1.p1  ORF type:complete len:178 (+),score=30.02 GEMP01043324.1:107-640(+)